MPSKRAKRVATPAHPAAPSEFWTADDSVLYHHTAPESWALLRRVSKGVSRAMSTVRMPRSVRFTQAYWDALPGNNADTRAVLIEKIATVVVTGRVESIALPNIGMTGMRYAMEPVLVAAITPALVHLDLHGNGFGPRGLAVLAPTLSRCTALVHLNLSNVQMCQVVGLRSAAELGRNVLSPMTQVLCGVTALRHLDLSCNFFGGSRGFASMCEAMVRSCPQLVHLDFSANNLGDQEMAGLLAQLCTTAIVDVNLAGNHMGERAVAALLDALPRWPSLARLDLRFCMALRRDDKARVRAVWVEGVHGVERDARALKV